MNRLTSLNKAMVPIGLTAASKQAPLLMHVEYRVSLPDHDYVIAPKHKLCPSVYAAVEIREGGFGNPSNVGYSGPTYIAVRSAKHTSATASVHAADFDKLITLEEFKKFARAPDGAVKPVVIITSDGGPDENPRYQKVIGHAVDLFKKHNLDALFLVTNAPGMSAYNRVERTMAPHSDSKRDSSRN